jgi:hypothetical protein
LEIPDSDLRFINNLSSEQWYLVLNVCQTSGDKDLSADNFDRVLIDAICEGLSSLGNSPREAIFRNLEVSFQIEKEQIPLNLVEFRKALETIFGPGTPYLERIIVNRLCKKLGLNIGDLETNNFVVCVEDLRRQLQAGREKNEQECPNPHC